MERVASCRCGQLTATCRGEPVRVSVCHCLNCQKRSGSAFAAQARWPDDQVTITGATQMTMKGEIVPPANMHAIVDTAGQVIEMTILDGKAWMNMAGTWTELPAAAAEQMAAGFNMANTDALDAMTEAQGLGTTNVDGKDVLSYAWKLDVEGSSTVNRAFVDPANGAPTRMETDVTAQGAVTNVVVNYTYDPSVTITAPAM